jgi:hypothetical protein
MFGERFFVWLGGRYGGKVVMLFALVFMVVAVVEYEGRK